MGIIGSMMLGYLFGVGVIVHPLAGSGRYYSIEWHCRRLIHRYQRSELCGTQPLLADRQGLCNYLLIGCTHYRDCHVVGPA
jgi:hypothetical protein